jgi:hypothetical protein
MLKGQGGEPIQVPFPRPSPSISSFTLPQEVTSIASRQIASGNTITEMMAHSPHKDLLLLVKQHVAQLGRGRGGGGGGRGVDRQVGRLSGIGVCRLGCWVCRGTGVGSLALPGNEMGQMTVT